MCFHGGRREAQVSKGGSKSTARWEHAAVFNGLSSPFPRKLCNSFSFFIILFVAGLRVSGPFPFIVVMLSSIIAYPCFHKTLS